MMKNTKEKVLERIDVRSIASFLTLAGIATMLPFFLHIQWITGPVINAILILVLFLSGLRSAVVVATVPSLMALSGGLLPVVLAPAVPFIMISNIIFVFTIDWFNERAKSETKGYWFGVFIGAGLKYIFLASSVSFIARLLLKQELAIKISQMMSWPQLATAILGGVIAWGVLKFIKRI